jgi:hypothetical protein
MKAVFMTLLVAIIAIQLTAQQDDVIKNIKHVFLGCMIFISCNKTEDVI